MIYVIFTEQVMKCKICGAKAEVRLKSHNIALCREHFLQFFRRRVERTIRKFKMFTKDARILVAVSGGKDSMGLLHLLNSLGYNVTGYHINLGIPEYSDISVDKVKKFHDMTGIPVIIESVVDELGFGIHEVAQKVHRPICSICGMVKRYMINRVAQKFDVVATGHNLDDEVATLFGNLLNWQSDYLARQYPVLPAADGFTKKVKPYVLVSEYESAIYTFFVDIDYVMIECPYSKHATSIFYKNIFNEIEDHMPGTKLRFLKGFYELRDIFPSTTREKLAPCEKCGYPTTAGVCSFCRLKDKLHHA